VQGRYGVVFAVQVQGWLSITRVAVQVQCERNGSHRVKVLCVAVERSGFITSYISVLDAGAKAKTMTNLLILLSVLGVVVFIMNIRLNSLLLF
jgi:hypothetical protein